MQKRIDYIDIAKGIGIILVVLGHSIRNDTLAFKSIYTFHMPLFFVLSGLVFTHGKYTAQEFFLKRVKTLIVPTIIFTVLCISVNWLFMGLERSGISQLTEGLPYALWFLPVLFLTESVYQFLSQTLSTGKLHLVICALFIIGCVLSFQDIHSPYSFFSLFPAITWFHIGYLAKRIANKTIGHSYSIIFSLLLFTFLTTLTQWGGISWFYKNDFEPLHLSYLCAVMGITATLLLSKSISSFHHLKAPLIFLGRNTLVIMCVHLLFITIFEYEFKNHFNSQVLFKLTQQAFVWILCIGSVFLINKYVPFLVGKKHRGVK